MFRHTFIPRNCCVSALTAPTLDDVSDVVCLAVLHDNCSEMNVRDCVNARLVVEGSREVKSVRRIGRSIGRGNITSLVRTNCDFSSDWRSEVSEIVDGRCGEMEVVMMVVGKS
jgi:hypothetical protein